MDPEKEDGVWGKLRFWLQKKNWLRKNPSFALENQILGPCPVVTCGNLAAGDRPFDIKNTFISIKNLTELPTGL